MESLLNMGLMVVDQNGLLIVYSDSAIMYLRSRICYSRIWILLHCYLHKNLFPNQDWKDAYRYITSKQQKSVNMEQTYTNAQLRAYLNAHYVPTFTKGVEDHFYNHRNRKTIALPMASIQSQFTEQEVVDMFSNGEHPVWIEIARFKTHIANNQIT